MPDAADGTARPRLLVAGLHLGGDGYPNARGTLAVLRERLGVEVVECGQWLPADFRLWQAGGSGTLSKMRAMWRLGSGNLLSALRVLRHPWRREAVVYVPYPAPFLLWLMSWVPRRLRPRLIADAYVSLWEAAAGDRARVGRATLAARGLHAFERRALRTAEIVLVDTVAHEAAFVDWFGLERTRVRSLPLATGSGRDPAGAIPNGDGIDRDAARSGTARGEEASASASVRELNLLFVGTLIPLHGVVPMLQALRPLLVEPGVRLRLVGDGQESRAVEACLAAMPDARVEWIREWQDAGQLRAQIDAADVCLGVFGGSGKASQVLPFKVYHYLAAGKPVVNQAAYSLPAGAPPPPLVTVDGGPESLVAAIRELRDDAGRRRMLGQAGAAYFRQWLGPDALASAWRTLLADLPPDQR